MTSVGVGVRAPVGVGVVLRALRRRWGLVAILLVAVVYVANAWTPSSYGHVTRMLGIARSGPVAGDSRPIRSDEWAVVTPYFQIAVANDLGPRNLLSPYRESLKAFFALPSRDWSMALKPDLWGFLVLDPAHAYSLHYAMLAAAFVAGFALLLRQLGCSPGVAVAVSATLFLSQFVQLWWTSNAPVLAYAPWPVVAYLWRAAWWRRAPAIALAVAVWLIGQLYPPFVIAAGLAFGVLVAAFRPDALAPGRLIPGLAAAAGGIGLAWLHYADLIPIMAATAYPGARVSDGGGVPPLWLAAQVFPHLVTSGYEPLRLWPTNACEISVVGSFLPLALLVFGDHRRLLAWIAAHRRGVAVWGLGLALLGAWVLLPIPGRFAPLLNLVPGGRMLWGVGLLFLLGVGVLASAAPWRDSPVRRGAFVAAVVAAWAVSKLVLSDAPLKFDGSDLVVIPILLPTLFFFGRRLPARRLVLAAVVLTAFATFGQFNPVQSAKPIFEARPSPVLDSFRAYADAHPRGWAVVPAVYGAVINGAGVPAINHTLLRPQMPVFRAAFPELDGAAFNETFNRYAFVVPEPRWAPAVPQGDVISLPPDAWAIPLPVRLSMFAAPSEGALERFEAVRLGPRRWGVSAAGWADWSGVAPGQALIVALADPSLGRIVKASAYRLARPDVVVQRNDKAAFAAGFGARIEVETAAELSALPRTALSFGSTDPKRGARSLPLAAP